MIQNDITSKLDERHQSPSIESLLWPALQVGALGGASGLIVGGVSGVLRSTTPVLFALASGIQWFTLGGTFWATRGMILRASDGQGIKPSDRIYASCIAGGFAGGSTAALMRGRANIMPGTLMFSLFGFVGQAIFNSLDARQIARTSVGLGDSSRPGSFWRRLGESKWTPVKVLSDEEYENMLQEKLLKVIAEIAIIDEKVEKLKETPDSVQTQGSQEKRNT